MIKDSTRQKAADLTARYPALAPCRGDLEAAVEIICDGYRRGGKLLICGNGGSAADAEHIVGELMKGFLLPRKLGADFAAKFREHCPDCADYFIENLQGALPAVSLVDEIALNTAFANDQAADLSFAQQVLGMGKEGDVLLGISTSGNSKNVIYAVNLAKALGLKTIALTGKSGGKLKAAADVTVAAPAEETYKIQEYHLPIYHMLCIAVENEFFGE